MLIESLKRKNGYSAFRVVFRVKDSALVQHKVLIFDALDVLNVKIFELGRVAIGEGSVPVLFCGGNKTALFNIKGIFKKNSILPFLFRSLPDNFKKITNKVHLDFLVYSTNFSVDKNVVFEKHGRTQILVHSLSSENDKQEKFKLIPAFLQTYSKEIPDPYKWSYQ